MSKRSEQLAKLESPLHLLLLGSPLSLGAQAPCLLSRIVGLHMSLNQEDVLLEEKQCWRGRENILLTKIVSQGQLMSSDNLRGSGGGQGTPAGKVSVAREGEREMILPTEIKTCTQCKGLLFCPFLGQPTP